MSAHRGGRQNGILGLVLAVGLLFGAAAQAQNVAPVISGDPPTLAPPGVYYKFQPTASDANGDRLTFGVSGAPGWARFDRSTGRLYGTPSKKHLGKSWSVRIAVSDGKLSAVLPLFTITVARTQSTTTGPAPVSPPPNSPPTLSGTPPASVVEGSPYSFAPTASDPDGNSLLFGISNKPAWASFSATSGLLSGTPPAGSAGTYSNVTISVSDGTSSVSLAPFSINVLAANRPPVIGGTPTTSVVEGELYGFVPTASDPDGNALKFSIANKPAWATFTASSGLLSGIPPVGSASTYSNITLSVSDGTSTAALAPFAITVTAKPNNPPDIWGVPALSVNTGETYVFKPSASDPDGQQLRFQVQGLPSWASFDTATGTLSGAPTTSHAGKYSGITISVTDGQASDSLAPFSVTVVAPDLPPTIRGTPLDSVTVGQAYGFTPSASDPEGKALTFSIANKPAWASFDTTSGRLAGSPTASQAGTYSGITISVSDGQNSAALPAFSVTVLAPTPGSATVSWSPPATNVDGTPVTNLAGFRVVYGQAMGDLSKSVNIPSPAVTSAAIEGLTPGTWYFAVKAYTAANVESDLSSVGQKTIN